MITTLEMPPVNGIESFIKVILYQNKYKSTGIQGRKRTKIEYLETTIFEDDGTEEGGKEIARVRDHAVAEQIAAAMKWEITENTKVEEE